MISGAFEGGMVKFALQFSVKFTLAIGTPILEGGRKIVLDIIKYVIMYLML